ncbi:MAG: HEPN domain-containing protein [Sphaerochaetaceae bacterium]|nr:HEPN domain-containing protein [Sphaerochaetaceae bacterium]
MNETASKEWLIKAWHHYSSAKVLFDASHYTDIIAVELHYSVEISLKSLLAYENKKIPKTHDLLVIYKSVKDFIKLSDEEISQTIKFSYKLFIKVCNILNIVPESLR